MIPVESAAVHASPTVSAHAFCGVPKARHLEYFHTHVRIEAIAFDGVLRPDGGALRPDPGRPGLGVPRVGTSDGPTWNRTGSMARASPLPGTDAARVI